MISFPYKPPTNTENMKNSVYYWWWMYLKRNKEYGPASDLHSDFGDVSGDDFWAWWRSEAPADDGRRPAFSGFDKWRSVYLFADPEKKYPFVRIKEPLPEEAYTDDSVLLLQVPLDEPDSELFRRFVAYVDTFKERYQANRGDETKDRRGIRAARSSEARYPVVGQPNVAALETTLKVYDYRLANPDLTLWEIWLALNPYLANKLIPKPRNEFNTRSIPNIKMSWAAGVSRYIKKAEAMIRNAGLGRFPDLS